MISTKKIYLDNASTTFPKPSAVTDKMVDFMKNIGSSPGRGGYSNAIEAGRLVFKTRELINTFFNGPNSENVIFTQNITMSLNTVIKGMFKPGWHIITTSMEHNSVMRPLRSLETNEKIKLTVIPCSKDGSIDISNIEKAITGDTRAVVMTHASNLTGTIMPVEEIGRICRDNNLFFILDSAQSAGILDIDCRKMHIDILAFTGHKSLLGPPGIGGFIISDKANALTSPLIEGGTGSNSHMETHPDTLPDKFESGTLNTVGIVGLKAGIEFINNEGLRNIRLHEAKLTDLFISGLKDIKGVDIYGPLDSIKQTGTISINIKNTDPAEIAYILDSEYGIMTRPGIHCTPSSHKTIGTFPRGTIRFSIGYFNTEDDIMYTLDTIRKISSMD